MPGLKKKRFENHSRNLQSECSSARLLRHLRWHTRGRSTLLHPCFTPLTSTFFRIKGNSRPRIPPATQPSGGPWGAEARFRWECLGRLCNDQQNGSSTNSSRRMAFVRRVEDAQSSEKVNASGSSNTVRSSFTPSYETKDYPGGPVFTKCNINLQPRYRHACLFGLLKATSPANAAACFFPRMATTGGPRSSKVSTAALCMRLMPISAITSSDIPSACYQQSQLWSLMTLIAPEAAGKAKSILLAEAACQLLLGNEGDISLCHRGSRTQRFKCFTQATLDQ